MTSRIPSAETKAWICTADDCTSVQPQLQQYFCYVLALLSGCLSFVGMNLKAVTRALAQDKLLGRLALRRWSCVPA